MAHSAPLQNDHDLIQREQPRRIGDTHQIAVRPLHGDAAAAELYEALLLERAHSHLQPQLEHVEACQQHLARLERGLLGAVVGVEREGDCEGEGERCDGLHCNGASKKSRDSCFPELINWIVGR